MIVKSKMISADGWGLERNTGRVSVATKKQGIQNY